MIDLYYDSSMGTHFFVGENSCSECNESISQKGIYVSMTCAKCERIAPKKYKYSMILKNKLFCHECVVCRRKIYDIVYWVEIKEVTICSVAPSSAIPIVIKPNYDVKDSRDLQGVLNTWIADTNKGIQSDTSSTVINNYTRLAGRESLEGAQIGLDPDRVNLKNNILSDNELDAFLLDVKNSRPVLGNDEKGSLIHCICKSRPCTFDNCDCKCHVK